MMAHTYGSPCVRLRHQSSSVFRRHNSQSDCALAYVAKQQPTKALTSGSLQEDVEPRYLGARALYAEARDVTVYSCRSRCGGRTCRGHDREEGGSTPGQPTRGWSHLAKGGRSCASADGPHQSSVRKRVESIMIYTKAEHAHINV